MKPSINQVIDNPELMNHDNCWSFYDWFCSERSLESKAKSFIPKLKFIVDEGLIDGDKTYVWFKNSCPCVGKLYDDMRFSTRDKHDEFLGGICPRSGHEIELKAEIWTIKPEFKTYEYRDWTQLKRILKRDEHFKAMIKEYWRVK